MITRQILQQFTEEARPIIERQLDDALQIAALRDAFTAQGGDWGALKALIKSTIQDERDDTGDRKRVTKVIVRSEATTEYADMLGLNLNEENKNARAA